MTIANRYVKGRNHKHSPSVEVPQPSAHAARPRVFGWGLILTDFTGVSSG